MDTGTPDNAASILVVEDDELVSEVLAEALQGSYRAASVGSAPAALERLGDRRYDLILLDCLIPGGGAELVIELAERLGIPLVLMSGMAERAAAASVGRHKFIAKPFSIDELLRTVEASLQTGR
jgi:CheY-like chemotaxis protein